MRTRGRIRRARDQEIRRQAMAKSIPLKPGDRVVIRPGEESDSLVIRGKIESRTWNSFTQNYQYGVAVPGPDGEAPEVITVREFEIWGVLDSHAER